MDKGDNWERWFQVLVSQGRLHSSKASALAVVLGLVGAVLPTPARAQGVCQTSAPLSAAYTVTVCLTDPVAGSIVSGRTTVAGTVFVEPPGPSVASVIFELDGKYVLTDLEGERTFELSTSRWLDGVHTLSMQAKLSDGFASLPTEAPLTFSNGTTALPTRTNTFTPRQGTTPADGEPFVVAAVGDAAAGKANDRAVSDLVTSWDPNMFLYLADVYEDASYTEFENYYGTGENYFSRLRDITNPTLGNHEYRTPGAAGYLDYWDGPPNYYQVTAGGWQIITIDSSSNFAQTAPGTAQYEWLKTQLTSDPNPCKLVYFHHPRFSVSRGENTSLTDLWALMANNGVDAVLNGHDHNYQRWKPLDAAGAVDQEQGATEFIVGTGGKSVYGFTMQDDRLAAGVDSAPGGYGALRMELNNDGMAYKYLSINGSQLDEGSLACKPAERDAIAPSAPTNLTANNNAGRVDLNWTESTDNVGIDGYDIFRDGTLLKSVGPSTSYSDGTTASNTTYTYEVRARDAAGNTSEKSAPAVVQTPDVDPLLFQDDFESGDLSKWTWKSGLIVQGAEVFAGSSAARATSTGTVQYARKTLSEARSEVFFGTRFKVISQGSDVVFLQRIRSADARPLVGLYATKLGELGIRNHVSSTSIKSTRGLLTPGWHDIQLRAVVGADSEIGVWLDGVKVDALSGSSTLGTTLIGGIELGESAPNRTFDVAFDDVVVGDRYVLRFLDTTAPDAPTDLAAIAAGSDRIDLSWTAASDNDAIGGYDVFRAGALVGSVGGDVLSYSDSGLESGTEYSYTVVAVDRSGNRSPASAPATATTQAPDTQAPTTPGGFRTTAVESTRVDLAWTSSTDDVGVTAYVIERDGTDLATVSGDAVAFSDTSVQGATEYTYSILARDAQGNESAPSLPVTVTTPAPTVTDFFADGFESGDLSQWTFTRGAAVQSQHVHDGSHAARVTYGTNSGLLRKTLSEDLNDLYVALHFKIIAKGSNTMYIARLRHDSNKVIGGVFVNPQNKLKWRNDIVGKTYHVPLEVVAGKWYELEIHARIAGSTSLSEVWLDGTKIDSFTSGDSLGTIPAGRVQVGEILSGQDAAFDNVSVNRERR